MTKMKQRRIQGLIAGLMAAAIFLVPISGLAQTTKIVYHANKYKINDDVKLGREAAQQAEQRYPSLRSASDKLRKVGQRRWPTSPEFQHPEFQYYSGNVGDINALRFQRTDVRQSGHYRCSALRANSPRCDGHELSIAPSRHRTGDQGGQVQPFGRDCRNCRHHRRRTGGWSAGAGANRWLLPALQSRVRDRSGPARGTYYGQRWL